MFEIQSGTDDKIELFTGPNRASAFEQRMDERWTLMLSFMREISATLRLIVEQQRKTPTSGIESNENIVGSVYMC